MYAHLLAGKPITICGDLICHQRFVERSILEEAIYQAQSAGLKVISTVRDVKRVNAELFLEGKEKATLLEARERVIDSVLYGLIEGILPRTENIPFRGDWGRQHSLKEYIKQNPEVEELTVLYSSSDIPCIQKKDFITATEEYIRLGRPDMLAMATRFKEVEAMDAALKLHLNRVETTLRNTVVTDKGELRISNMYIVKPFKLILSGLAGSLQKVYDHRYLSEGVTAWLGAMSGLGKIFISGIQHNPMNTIKTYQQIALAGNHIQGKKRQKVIHLQELEERTSQLLGLQIKISTEGSAATLLDIDDEATLQMYREKYKEIVEYYSGHF